MPEIKYSKKVKNFLKNFRLVKSKEGEDSISPNDGSRLQNTGKYTIHRILIHRYDILDLDSTKVTGYIWIRNGVTFLKNSGMNIINLKRTGSWNSLSSCKEYLEHSLPVQYDHMNRLDGVSGGEFELIKI